MRVAITGARGFLGRAVQARFERTGAAVVPIDAHDGHDVRDAETVARLTRNCDVVIHLAGILGTSELFERVTEAVDVNVVGTVNVLDACRANRAAYVGVSMPKCWPSVYQATKHCAVDLATAYHHAHGLRVAHVLAYNAYGPGQAHGPGHPQKIIPTFATCAHLGEPIPIWGSGNQTVDLIHVDDIAEVFYGMAGAITASSEWPAPQVAEAGSGVEVSVLDVARRVCEIADAPFRVEFLPMRAGELPETRLCASRSAFGVDPLRDPRLAETVASYAPVLSAVA